MPHGGRKRKRVVESDDDEEEEEERDEERLRVRNIESWKVLEDGDSADEELIVHPKESYLGDSVMMSDAMYAGNAAEPVVGDTVRSQLYDEWYFKSEHTHPGGSLRMQEEMENILRNTDPGKEQQAVMKHMSRVIATRRAATTASKQKMRSLGVTQRECNFDLQPGATETLVCPVREGDMFMATFLSGTATVEFTLVLVKPGSREPQTLKDRVPVDPSNAEHNPPVCIVEIKETCDVVLSWSLAPASPPTLLSVIAMKRTAAAVIRNRESLRRPKRESTWVCAACGFARPHPLPPVAGRTQIINCLMCSYAEGCLRSSLCTPPTGPPGEEGSLVAHIPTPLYYPTAKGHRDVFGTLFSVPPHSETHNHTPPDYGMGPVCFDLYVRPLPDL